MDLHMPFIIWVLQVAYHTILLLYMFLVEVMYSCNLGQAYYPYPFLTVMEGPVEWLRRMCQNLPKDHRWEISWVQQVCPLNEKVCDWQQCSCTRKSPWSCLGLCGKCPCCWQVGCCCIENILLTLPLIFQVLIVVTIMSVCTFCFYQLFVQMAMFTYLRESSFVFCILLHNGL